MDELAQLLGESPAISLVREKLRHLLERQWAGQRLPALLIQGETGTGKGLVARLVHRMGPRKGGPFVDINCPAIPETLLEAELFGFERGAFTGAHRAKPGLFQAAHGGTLFLDEIGLLPESVQGKLLAAIEERSVRRLGSTQPESVDVCFISATNTDLRAALKEHRFREDLYHRLAVITLDLPPLRDRDRDVLFLAERFLARTCAEYHLSPKRLDAEAQACLRAHAWPGNIRELANVIERAALFAESAVITGAMLGPLQVERPLLAVRATRVIDGAITPEEAMYQHLVAALEASGWNLSHTAARLGIARNTLYARLEKYGVRARRLQTASRTNRAETALAPVPTGTHVHWERRGITLLSAMFFEPEGIDARSLTSRALDIVIDKLQTFGGRIEELTPTGVLASFGVDPVDDAPRRAAHAALAIHKRAARTDESTGRAPGVKIALHEAQLLIGRSETRNDIDADARREQRAVLDQLLETIGMDMTVVSAAAAPFLERRFELVPIDVGKDRADQLFRLTGQERRGLGVWGAMTRFVGRQDEIDVLEVRLAAAGSGHGQLVAVSGEPGVGKSRLCWEFTHSRHVDGWRLLQARALPYGKTTPYLPAIDLLKAYCGIGERDDQHAVREKVTRKLLALDPGLELALPAFLALLDLPVNDRAWQALDAPGRRRHTLDALKCLLIRESQVQPLVLMFEDLHWVDGETQALIDGLVESLPTARLLLLVNYRPEYQDGWGSKTHYSQLRLDTLPPESTGELLNSLVGDDPAMDPLKQLLIQHGNPFFIEESIRTLVETGALTRELGAYRLARPIQAIEVPATVQVILSARIDRLPANDKRLLQTAAVIGKDVPVELLHAVAEEAEETVHRGLAHLQATEFLYETRLLPDHEYTFKHALTHEVTYGTLLEDRRKVLHARIVAAIERLYAQRLIEHVERLAHHAARGEMWDRAVDYLRKAGAKAYARGALSDSRERYQEALDLLTRLPATPENLRRGIDVRLEVHAPLLGLGELQRTTELHQQAGDLARQLEDRPRLGRIAARMANLAWLDTRYSSAIELAQEALRTAATDDPDVRAETIDVRINATHILGLTYLALGQYRASREHLRQNVEGPVAAVARQPTGFTIPAYVFGCGLLAWGSAILGDFEPALAYGRRGVDEAEVSGSLHAQAAATTYLAMALVYRGQYEAALPWCERGLRLSETGGVGFWRATAHSIWGLALAGSGDPLQGLPHLEQGAVLQENAGIKAIRSSFWIRWGEALLLSGDVLKARSVAGRALELAATSSERGFEAEAHCVLARAAAEGRVPEMEAAWIHHERAFALASELDMRPLLARCHLGLGVAHRRTGNRQQAKNHITTAAAMFREMSMQFWLTQAEAELHAVAADLEG